MNKKKFGLWCLLPVWFYLCLFNICRWSCPPENDMPKFRRKHGYFCKGKRRNRSGSSLHTWLGRLSRHRNGNRSYHCIQLRLARKQRLGCHQVARALLLFTWSMVGGVFSAKKAIGIALLFMICISLFPSAFASQPETAPRAAICSCGGRLFEKYRVETSESIVACLVYGYPYIDRLTDYYDKTA